MFEREREPILMRNLRESEDQPGALPRVPASAKYVGKGRALPKDTGEGPRPPVADKEEQAFEASVSI